MIKAITEGPHPGIVANLSNIAVLHQILGDTLASKTNFLQAMEMAETLLGMNIGKWRISLPAYPIFMFVKENSTLQKFI